MTDHEQPQYLKTTTPIEIAFVNAPADAPGDRSPIPGMRMQEFRNWLIRAIDGDPAVPASIRLAVAAGSREAEAQGKSKDQEWWELFMWQYALNERLREIDQLVNRYNELADWHHAQAELARGKMREAGDELAAIDEFLTGAKDVLGGRERTGKLDREKAIELLRTRGVAVDPYTNDGQLAILIVKQQAAARSEREAWSKQYEQSKTEATNEEEMERECRKKAEELVQKRDEIRNHGYDAREETLRLRQVTEEYQRDIQRKAVDIEISRSGDAFHDISTLEKNSIREARGNQSASEVDDFEALAAGALSGEFAKAAKGETAAPMPLQPVPPGSNGSSPVSKNSFG